MDIKVFISQPMNGRSNEEITKERQEIIKELEEEYFDMNVIILDSFFEGAPHDAKPLWFLAKSLELLAQADIAYFCKGWENYRGCRIENTCAIEYGIEQRGYISTCKKG